MKHALTRIGLAAMFLVSVINPFHTQAMCGCVTAVQAMPCPYGGAAPIFWGLNDRNGAYKPWPNWQTPVPFADGDYITVVWPVECCNSVQGGTALSYYWNDCPGGYMHFGTKPLEANCNGNTWRAVVDCNMNLVAITRVGSFYCNGQ